MPRFALVLEYDGTRFHGFQTQGPRRTVQSVLEAAIAKRTGAPARVTPAGRTDAGVHALAMVASFECATAIPGPAFAPALNTLLPPDVRVLASSAAREGFDARRDCRWRAYRYRILNRAAPSALERDRTLWHPRPLAEARMHRAAQLLLGPQDFAALATRHEASTVRTIHFAEAYREREEVVLRIAGNGFLRHMVRAIIGSLLLIGRGEREPEWLGEALAARHRSAAGPNAAPQGLYFEQAGYAPWPEAGSWS